MSQFTQHKTGLIAGISELKIAPTSWVKDFPAIKGSALPFMEFSFLSGYDWIDIPFLDKSALLESKPNKTQQGVSYLKEISCLLPGDIQENLELLESLENETLLIYYKDSEGTRKLLSTIDEPAGLEFTFKQNIAPSPYGYEIRLSGVTSKNSLFFTTPILPQFTINSDGQLEYLNGLSDSIAIDSNGKMTVTGNQESRYSLSSRGAAQFQ